jgi:steroid delta-isomerase-like uncharacterized protein
MSTEENKTIVRRSIEEFNQGNLAVIDELFAPDFVYHDPANPQVRSREDYKQWITGFFAAFPDVHASVEDMLAEEDRVAYRYTLRATQSGSWRGAAPTGKAITVTSITIARLADGKIAEGWQNADALGLVQQLGVIPTPGQASE